MLTCKLPLAFWQMYSCHVAQPSSTLNQQLSRKHFTEPSCTTDIVTLYWSSNPYRLDRHDENHVDCVLLGQALDGGDGRAGLDPDAGAHPGLTDAAGEGGGGVGGLDVEGVLRAAGGIQ